MKPKFPSRNADHRSGSPFVVTYTQLLRTGRAGGCAMCRQLIEHLPKPLCIALHVDNVGYCALCRHCAELNAKELFHALVKYGGPHYYSHATPSGLPDSSMREFIALAEYAMRLESVPCETVQYAIEEVVVSDRE